MTKQEFEKLDCLANNKQLLQAIKYYEKDMLNQKLQNLIWAYDKREYPKFHHKQIFLKVGDQEGLIDEEIVSLIKAIWKKGIYTALSCQENKPGIVWIEFQSSWDASQFLNLVGKEFGTDLYGRIANWGEGDDWVYDCTADNIYEGRECPITKKRQKVEFHFFVSIRFPKADVPEIIRRLECV